MEKIDCCIIGAGVIGLSIARTLSKRFSCLVIEKHDSFGRETSSRNSEVIHGGIYYPQNSLKAKFCTHGKTLLYDYCKEKNIACKAIGKIIIAKDESQLYTLEKLKIKATNNGVNDLSWLSKDEISQSEPLVKAAGGLFSPSTGILDTHTLMKSLESDIESSDGILLYNSSVETITKNNNGYEIEIIEADGKFTRLQSDLLINSAGLNAAGISSDLGVPFKYYPSKGEYFQIKGIKAFSMKHLIYPPPEKDSLGIHTVIDLNGHIKLGPNAFYTDEINYNVDESHRDDFFNSTKSYLPFLKKNQLTPDMAGFRPKLQSPQEDFSDFYINEETEKGLPGFINLVGIESPGLTSCLAISEYVKTLI